MLKSSSGGGMCLILELGSSTRDMGVRGFCALSQLFLGLHYSGQRPPVLCLALNTLITARTNLDYTFQQQFFQPLALLYFLVLLLVNVWIMCLGSVLVLLLSLPLCWPLSKPFLSTGRISLCQGFPLCVCGTFFAAAQSSMILVLWCKKTNGTEIEYMVFTIHIIYTSQNKY